MKNVLLLLIHLLTVVAKLLGPGGIKGIIAENLLLKQQLLVVCRPRQRAPNLSPANRFLFGFFSLFIRPGRITKTAVGIRALTLLRFRDYLVRRKYRALYSIHRRGKPGPKVQSQELIHAIVELKCRNSRFGYPRIALIISKTFGIEIDRNIVRCVLAKYYHPENGGNGPSWLTFIGHMKDSLWSVDLFRCESITLKSHWVMVVMDQFTRRIIGFEVHAGNVNGMTLCQMFNKVIAGKFLPRYLSSDNDPQLEYHRWQANLRDLEVDEIKAVPDVPVSHTFVERLIGTIRREYIDHIFFWNTVDLERKLNEFKDYYNHERVHALLGADTPAKVAGESSASLAKIHDFRWQMHSRGLVQLPVAA